MEVTPGYKQTEVGVIPEDWDVRSGESITVLIGKGASPRWQGFQYTDSGMLFVTSENVRSGFLDVSSPKYLSLAFHEKLGRTKLRTNDILVNLVGASIGRSCVIRRDLGAANVNQAVAVFRVKEHVSAVFVSFVFQAPSTIRRLLEMQVEAARQNISLSNLRNFLVPLPTKAEQDVIAEALSDADALIESLEQLIAKRRRIKQGTMQELLGGKRRLPGFSGEWGVHTFAGLFSVVRNASNARSELSEDGDIAYVHYGDVHSHPGAFLNVRSKGTYIARDKVRSIPRLADGDLLMADASEDTDAIGKAVEIVGLNGQEAVAGLHTIALRGKANLIVDGFKGYLQYMPQVRTALVRLATGVSVFGVTKSGVMAIEVTIPKPEEQAAISAVLRDLDAEIDIAEERLAKARCLKQAMMHELLTGRVRLI